MRTKTRRLLIQSILLIILAVVIAAVSPTMAHAKKKKKTKKKTVYSVTLPYDPQAGDSDREVLVNTAVSVMKGKTVLYGPGPTGNIVFKAPKKKTYTFTFSNLRVPEQDPFMGSEHPFEYAQIEVVGSNLHQRYVKTQHGSDCWLQICTPAYLSDLKEGPQTTYSTTTMLLSRYGKAKLKKGERLYFHISSIPNFIIDLQIQ